MQRSDWSELPSKAVFAAALLTALELLFLGLHGLALGIAGWLLGIFAYWLLSVAGVVVGPVAVVMLARRRRWIMAGVATLLLLPGLVLTATALPVDTKAHVVLRFQLQRPLYNQVAEMARRGDLPLAPRGSHGRRLPLYLCPVAGTCHISTIGQGSNGHDIIYLPNTITVPDGDSSGYAHFIGPPTIEKALVLSGCPLYSLGDGWWWFEDQPRSADRCQWAGRR